MATNTAVTGLSIPDYDFDYQFKAPVGTIMRDSKGIPMVKTGDGVWQANDGALLYAYAAAQNDPAIAAALGSDYLERAKTNALASQNSSYYQDALSMNYGLAPTGSGSQATPTSYATGNTQSNNANYSAGTQQSQSQPQTQQTSSSSYNTTPAATQTQQSQVGTATAQQSQYPAYDYGKSLDYADRAMTTTDMGQATNAYGVQNQINKAANTLSQSSFQDGTLVGQLTGDILSNLAPVRQQQQNAINQQYDASRRALQEAQAARGGVRSGTGMNQLLALEQARNQQLAQAQAGLVQGALAQALPFGQLALSEKGLLQGQQQTAANQLASLLGQQESSRQWAEGFNADQLQRQFANYLATQQAQAAENQFGSQFGLGGKQLELEYAKLGQQESQFGRNLEQQAKQFAESLGLDYANLSQQDKQFLAQLAEQQAAREQSSGQWQQQFEHGKDIDAANLLGIYGGQQTLAAQQLANQLAQQALANKYTEAGLTGRFQDASGNWVDTLPGQQLQQQKDSAADMLATQLLSAYLSNSPNAAVPQSAINWINQMFGR